MGTKPFDEARPLAYPHNVRKEPQENRRISHHILSFDKEAVDAELAVSLVIHFHHQTFVSSMAKIRHCPFVKAGSEQVHHMAKHELYPGQLSKLGKHPQEFENIRHEVSRANAIMATELLRQ